MSDQDNFSVHLTHRNIEIGGNSEVIQHNSHLILIPLGNVLAGGHPAPTKAEPLPLTMSHHPLPQLITLCPNLPEKPRGHWTYSTAGPLSSISKCISVYSHPSLLSGSDQKMIVLPVSLNKASPLAFAIHPLLSLVQENVSPHSHLFPTPHCWLFALSLCNRPKRLPSSSSSPYTLSFALLCCSPPFFVSQTSQRTVYSCFLFSLLPVIIFV